MSTDRVFFPYGRASGIRLEASGFRDAETGFPLQDVGIPNEDEFGDKRILLFNTSPSWTTLEFDVEFSVEAGGLDDALPDPRRVTADADAIVSVGCSATKLRFGVRLTTDGTLCWRGVIQLSRDEIAGLVHLRPILVRNRGIRRSTKTDGFATFEGAVLGDGAGIELVIDRGHQRFEGDFKYVWEDFKTSTNPWVASRPKDVFYFNPLSIPLVHLNLHWQSLQPILNSKAFSGPDAALKYAYGAVIGQDVWTQLLVIAVASIRSVDDDWSVQGDQWRADYAAHVGAALFPDYNEKERLEQLHEQFHDAGSVATLISQLGSIAHELSGAGKLLDRAAKAVHHQPPSTDADS